VVGLGCAIVVSDGPETGPLEEQATANANSGAPMLIAARVRRGARRLLGKPELIVTEGATIRSSIAPAPPGSASAAPIPRSSARGGLAATG